MTTKLEFPSFHYVFQLTKMIMFEVNYYRCGSNSNKYFSTSASELNKQKNDYDRCGQAQNSLLWGSAMKFYKKWDEFHTKDIPSDKFDELLSDIEQLKAKYNYILRESDSSCFFGDIVDLSKLPRKK